MHMLTIRDDAIWIKHIDADTHTKSLLGEMVPGTRVLMEIEGIRGEWEKMANGADGRPTHGLKPVGEMKTCWKNMQSRRGQSVSFRILERKDSYLAPVQALLTEWESDEDESAFRDL